MAQYRNIFLFAAMALLILLTGFLQSWNSALLILNMGLISAIMSLGVNLQWGFAGLFNVGVMGFVALGGLATVLISMPPVTEAWSAGGLRTMLGLVIGVASLWLTSLAIARLPSGNWETILDHVGEAGVTISHGRNLRLVCHKDITSDGVDIALQAFQQAATS